MSDTLKGWSGDPGRVSPRREGGGLVPELLPGPLPPAWTALVDGQEASAVLVLCSESRGGCHVFAFPWDFEEDTCASIVQDFSDLSLRS